MNFECCLLERAQVSPYGWDRKCQSVAHVGQTGWTHPLDKASRANHEQWNDDRSILFHSCPDQMKYCKVQHQQLTLGQFVPLPMHGWNWPVLEMFRISGTCLSHRTRITAMNVCDSPQLLLNASCSAMRCKNGVPHICHAWRTWTWPCVKAESDMALSFEDSRSSAPVETLLHSCIKLDVQKGGCSDRSPTIVKNNALMSSSSNFRSLCANMTLPFCNKWHSCHVDCRAGLAPLAREYCKRMWRREKFAAPGSCCWILNRIWIKEVKYHLSMEANLDLWILRWFHLL